jgi:hypothetical protein
MSIAGKPPPPPLGVMPESLWNEKYPDGGAETNLARVVQLRGALQRYRDAGKAPPPEWLEELKRREPG